MATKKKRARRRAKAAMKRTNHTWLTMYDCNSLPNVKELFTKLEARRISIGDDIITWDSYEHYPVCLDCEDKHGVKFNILLGRCRSLEDQFFEAAVCYEGEKPELREFLLDEICWDYKVLGKNEWYEEMSRYALLNYVSRWCIPRDPDEYEDEGDLMDDPEMAAYETRGA